jgi:hypothetical protein
MKTVETSVLEMAKGAILEQTDNEMTKILSNILDPNTDPKKVRSLTITVKFKPDESREYVSVEAQAKSNIAPIMPIATRMILEADKDGNPKAMELTRDDPNQVHMFEEGEEQPVKVLRLAWSV